MSKILFLLAFFTSFIFLKIKASDTIKINKTISLDNIGENDGVDTLLIRNKSFLVPLGINKGFFNYLTYPKDKYTKVYFRKCYFDVFESQNNLIVPPISDGFFVFDSCNINYLPIINTSGKIVIASSQISILTVDKTSNLNLGLTQNKSMSFLKFENNRNLKLQIYNSNFKNSSQLKIYSSSISELTFAFNEYSGCNAYFQNDTINSFVSGFLDNKTNDLKHYKEWYKFDNTFTFQNCHINASFIFFEHIPNSTIIFNNCTFGEDLDISDLAIDKLVFKNCKQFPLQTYIGFREQEKDVKLQIVKTNIENLSFEFSPNYILDFDSTDSEDIKLNSYKYLMDKFESEGKSNSYMNIDLQYRKHFKFNDFNFLNYIWWYYGYKPWLVFVWTVVLLIIFSVLNYCYINQIFDTYNLNEEKTKQILDGNESQRKIISYVLVYTLFVFFTVGIDFGKLNFSRIKFVFIFLMQYFVGLWCVLFMIRFIFKL